MLVFSMPLVHCFVSESIDERHRARLREIEKELTMHFLIIVESISQI